MRPPHHTAVGPSDRPALDLRHTGADLAPDVQRTIHTRLAAVGVTRALDRARAVALADLHLSRLATYDALHATHGGRFDSETVLRIHLVHAVGLGFADAGLVDRERVMLRTQQSPSRLAVLLWDRDATELLAELAVARWALETAAAAGGPSTQLVNVRVPIHERVETAEAHPPLGRVLDTIARRVLPRVVPALARSVSAGGQATCIAERHRVDPDDALAVAIDVTGANYWVGQDDAPGFDRGRELTAARLEAGLFHHLQTAGFGKRDARDEAQAQRPTLEALTAFRFGPPRRPAPGSQAQRSQVARLRRTLYGALHGHTWQACGGRLQPPPVIVLP